MLFVLLPRKEVALYRIIKGTFDGVCTSQCLVVENTPGLNPRKDVSRGAGHLSNIMSKVNQKLVSTIIEYPDINSTYYYYRRFSPA